MTNEKNGQSVERRDFLKTAGALAAASVVPTLANNFAQAAESGSQRVNFKGPDSLFHGHAWESLNPGYWQIKNGALRRRLSNYGDQARATGFPFHYETHQRNAGVMNMDYDPSLREGIIYRRDWKLTGGFTIKAKFTHQGQQHPNDAADWKMHQDGYGLMGIAIGAKSLLESYGKNRNTTTVAWTDDNRFGVTPKAGGKRQKRAKGTSQESPKFSKGDRIEIEVQVAPLGDGRASLRGTLTASSGAQVSVSQEVSQQETEGYIGIIGRGLLDFEVNEFQIDPQNNRPLSIEPLECYTCYPLGDTLKKVGDKWQVRFVALFASEGEEVAVRVADSESPGSGTSGNGWEQVPVAGKAKIVNNKWRRNTASIDVTLPFNPAEKTQFFTVWKDGKNVTEDTRIGTAAVGPGTGFVGDVPASGTYVGRLPQLLAPYKICGLSCHAITNGLQQRTDAGLKILGGGDEWQFRDQPTVEAYKHLDDYGFQIMCWEDDVWYLELVLYPPSTDDAYKVITHTIAGPTSRWQMMRHWNVINPGDHDYGMDDVKGPEQIVLRIKDGLGQDRDYMRRNFQIVQHLLSGEEDVDPLANPKKWRSWKMPNRDFTLAILDSRLWRSSQDTKMWDDEGWGHMNELYDRADPTRSLLGEEQFAWLQELVKHDSSRLICLTGLNGLHTVWTGGKNYSHTNEVFGQRDRVAADYAGWVAAGADRVIELLGSRDGIVTVYGDVHNGCIMKNTAQGLIECSFGPIGRSGGRAVIPKFGRKMKDFDGRDLEVTSLYHKTHANPDLEPQSKGDPFYWNFLEMEFDPTADDPAIGLRVRNMIDAPKTTPRGGGSLETQASQTGRKATSQLPPLSSLPSADVQIALADGRPLRGTRSDSEGKIPDTKLQIPPDTTVILTAYDGKEAKSHLVKTVGV